MELPPGPMIRDTLNRPLGSLRVSVTDRCNLRCRYCMPEAEYVWLPKSSILTFEEIARLVRIFTGLGVAKVRLTGGEPLLRHDLPTLARMLAENHAIRDLALTTNGLLLARQADALQRAGLHRVTVSLDTLRPERMQALARTDRHADVLAGIAAARRAGFPLKLNTVVMRGVNDDELADLIEFGRAHEAEVRFIEYMDVGGATGWRADQVFSQREILATLSARYGVITPVPASDAAAPAERFRLTDGTTFGIVASTTAPFCSACDRSRQTAHGFSVSTRHKDSTCASRCGAVRAMPTSPIALPERGAGAWTAAPRSASILKIARRCTASGDYELIHIAKCILEEVNSDD